ncbi:MAG: hypothetical protein JO362_11160 [Streptomycetaceae bacterium]|nr:hypothetical protein [Streptomycetaceae bacterium]
MKKRSFAPTAAAAIAAGVLLTGVCGYGNFATTTSNVADRIASPAGPGTSIDPGGPMQPAPTPRISKQPIDQPVTAQGRTLTTKAVAGGCRTAQLVSQETPTTVTLTILVTNHQKPGELCSFIAMLTPVSTTLKAPLGSRQLIDGATGKQLPAPQ